MNIKFDDAFPHDYEIRTLPNLVHFPGQGAGGPHYLLLEITTPQRVWAGAFRSGDGKLNNFTSCPRPWELCVVAGGAAYIANTRDPESYEPTIYGNIKQVVCAKECGIILLATDWSVSAYRHAPLWDSGQICLDELQIESVSATHALLSCWDPNSTERRSFSLDLRTGKPTDYRLP